MIAMWASSEAMSSQRGRPAKVGLPVGTGVTRSVMDGALLRGIVSGRLAAIVAGERRFGQRLPGGRRGGSRSPAGTVPGARRPILHRDEIAGRIEPDHGHD